MMHVINAIAALIAALGAVLMLALQMNVLAVSLLIAAIALATTAQITGDIRAIRTKIAGAPKDDGAQ